MALISANTSVILTKFIFSDLKAKPIRVRSKSLPVSAISVSCSSALATALPSQKEQIADSLCGWGDFGKRVSGEWNGFGADFTAEGNPVELPESVVPEDFREWEVRVYDWQTQCPTLASESTEPLLFYKLIKLFPTVGCEADAAMTYIIDKRVAGGTENNALALGYHPGGRYLGVWPVNGFEGKMMLELEHCIVSPKNWEERVRVLQVIRFGEGMMSLEKISVFSEEWYGPFNDGELLGGCSLKETTVAMTSTVEVSEVLGAWKGSESFAVARFEGDDKVPIHHFLKDCSKKLIRDHVGLITLPKGLWSSLKMTDNGEKWAEVGWLIGCGHAITSRCVFHDDGRLKKMEIAEEFRLSDEKAN